MSGSPDRIDRKASLRIILTYAVFAMAWIYLSDLALEALGTDPGTLTRIAIFKGFLFIAVTAALLHKLILRHFRSIREAEEKRGESETLLRTLAECTSDAIYAKTTDGRYTLFNEAAARFTGKSAGEAIGRDDRVLFPPEEAEALIARDRAVVESGVTQTYEERLTLPDGKTHTFLSTKGPLRGPDGAVTGLFGIARDVTDRMQLEEQLRQAQKMEAIGQLAGGVAHDFNNILTVIYGYCKLIRMHMKDGEKGVPELDQVIAAAERAAHLTRSLLAFSRKQVMDVRPVELNGLVRNLERMLARILGEDLLLKTEFRGRTLPVIADAGQIEQVLLNLATNARDAMPKGGALLIETGIAEIAELPPDPSGDRMPGRYAVLSVTDTGTGIDEKTIPRIFEPFFTTKDVGKGTGLGLSMVYGIVRQHGGFVDVESEAGRGSTFRVHLPLAGYAEIPGEEAAAGEDPGTGSETVLVAEDDESIRRFLVMVLENFGYTAIPAGSGDEAIRRFAAEGERIDGVILDVIMPGRSGVEACAEIRRIRPGTKVLFVSGYSPDLLQGRGLAEPGVEILTKPIHPMELVRKLRDLFDSK